MLLLLVFSCQKKENYEDVRILGHAANGIDIQSSVYHDNTSEAVNLALSVAGCDGIEIDIQLSADFTLWLFHDAEMSAESSESGCVNSKKDSELEQIHYRSVHQEKLVRLNSLPVQDFSGRTLMLDLRHSNFCLGAFVSQDSMLVRLKQFRNSLANLNVNLITITNNETWISGLQTAGFQVVYSGETLEDVKSVAASHSLYGIIMKNKAISEADVTYFKNQQLEVFIFEVRSPKGIRSALKKHPDFLLSDDIQAALIEKYR